MTHLPIIINSLLSITHATYLTSGTITLAGLKLTAVDATVLQMVYAGSFVTYAFAYLAFTILPKVFRFTTRMIARTRARLRNR